MQAPPARESGPGSGPVSAPASGPVSAAVWASASGSAWEWGRSGRRSGRRRRRLEEDGRRRPGRDRSGRCFGACDGDALSGQREGDDEGGDRRATGAGVDRVLAEPQGPGHAEIDLEGTGLAHSIPIHPDPIELDRASLAGLEPLPDDGDPLAGKDRSGGQSELRAGGRDHDEERDEQGRDEKRDDQGRDSIGRRQAARRGRRARLGGRLGPGIEPLRGELRQWAPSAAKSPGRVDRATHPRRERAACQPSRSYRSTGSNRHGWPIGPTGSAAPV